MVKLGQFLNLVRSENDSEYLFRDLNPTLIPMLMGIPVLYINGGADYGRTS